MMLRRAGGRVRWLPGDVLAWPVLLVGLALLTGLDLVKNRVADGPYTVRLLVAAPSGWFTEVSGWIGLALVAAGVTLSILARRLADPRRSLTAVRYLPFRAGFALLAAATLLSLWSLSSHVTDLGSAGAQWRFIATPRVRWLNDLTTILLGVGSLVCLVFSFGRLRALDFDDYASRERVPTTTAPRASTSRTMPTGVATNRRSTGSRSPPDDGA